MTNNQQDKFARWQEIAITQFGYSINLILGLAVGALAFASTTLLSDGFEVNPTVRGLLLLSCLTLLFSILGGIGCVISRLLDFRTTRKVTRLKTKGKGTNEIEDLRESAAAAGKRTWRLFWFQIGSFAIGVFVLVLAVTIHFFCE